MLAFDNWRSKLSINACTIYSHDMVRVLRAYPCMHRAIGSCRFYCKSYFICACSTYSYMYRYSTCCMLWSDPWPQLHVTMLIVHEPYLLSIATSLNMLLCMMSYRSTYYYVTTCMSHYIIIIMHACCTCYCDGLKWQCWSCTYTASISFATATYVMSDVMVAAVTTYMDNVTSNVIKLWQLFVCNP